MATEKVQWVYEARDKLTPELKQMDKQYDSLQRNVKQTETKTTSAMSRSKQSIGDTARQVPMLGSAFDAITSPVGAAATAITGVGLAAGKAISAASTFEDQFTQIEQLNLGRPQEELTQYREDIIQTSKDINAMTDQTAKAFFDVQSATGLFGDEVQSIVSDVGEFADATSADLTTSINAAVKQYRNFDIETGNFDRALESNIKTVQTGIVTYDELARVQADYAGTASAANQTIDSANKLFAAFTSSAKNTEEAATLTKTAFESLAEKSTIKTLEEFNIQMTDMDGNLLQVDTIMQNLVRRFDSMSPQQMRAMKEEVGGTEGLTMLLNQAQNQGDDLLETFKSFDNTEADISKVTEKAEDDLSKIQNDLMADINAEFTELGDSLMPAWISALKLAKQELSILADLGSSFSDSIGSGLSNLGDSQLLQSLIPGGNFLATATDFFGGTQQESSSDKQRGNQNNGDQQPTADPDFLNSMMGVDQQQNDPLKNLTSLNSVTNKNGSLGMGLFNGSNQNGSGAGGDNEESGEEIDGVVSGGKRTKQVNVSIESLINELMFNTESPQEGLDNMDERIKEALIRAVRDAEIALSQSS